MPARTITTGSAMACTFGNTTMSVRTLGPKNRQNAEPIPNRRVIGAVIDLGNCLNLMDSASIHIVKQEFELLSAELELLGEDLPQNHGRTQDRLFRNLDCAVIEHLHERIRSDGLSGLAPSDSVRGLFFEGHPMV